MADIFQIPMTPDQFTKLLEAVKAPNNGVNKFTPTTDNATCGNVETSDIDFSYDYDGTGNCTVTLGKRKSFKAKLASVDQIKSRLVNLLANG